LTSPAQFFAVGELRTTWRQLRKELRQATIRDVVDWIDWARGIDQSLSELHAELCDGSYHPSPPSRFEVPKAAGAFRIITTPHIRDALVYRHISDSILARSIGDKVKGAFFSRSHSATPIGDTFSIEDDPSLTALEVWLRYNEYRSLTLLNQPYRILVVSDISNYFDSISHDLLIEHFAPTGLPREVAGLLGKLLEALRPTAGHSSAPRIGLAVDEFDCSRQLAHVFLFAHDRRVATEFGEDNYVRWMDDHNLGVDSPAEARRVVNFLTRSLAQQRLTLNSGKTRFLTPADVAVHFQLEANKRLNRWNAKYSAAKKRNTPKLVASFRLAWNRILSMPSVGKGNWDKVLKRVYGMATMLDIADLEHRALADLIAFPYLSERIFVYFARRNRGAELLLLFRDYMAANENLHEFVESRFFEACLLLSPSGLVRNQLRLLAALIAKGRHQHQTGRPLPRASAILCMYWLGSSATELDDLFDHTAARGLPKEVARAWLACVTARSPRLIDPLLHRLVGNGGDDVARLARFVILLTGGRIDSIGSYYSKRPRWPGRGYCYDTRSWLLLELSSHSDNPAVRNRTKSDVSRFAKLAVSWPERAALERIRRRVS
jgi:Reverse transcriptase (RNA-dependent DNA polymerase)